METEVQLAIREKVDTRASSDLELEEAMIRLHDVEVEKPKFREIRGNPVWL